MYLLYGPSQVFFQCGPEMPEGWTPLVREIKDNMKCNNIHITEISQREEKEQGIENLFEKIMTENFPDLLR